MTNASLWLLLAQGDAGPGSILTTVWPIPVLFFMFYWIVMRPESQRKKAHQEMLNAIKQNDRVVTIGGVYGVVTNVRREADEVTVRIDDTTNTKMRVTFNSIARILIDGAGDDKEKSS